MKPRQVDPLRADALLLLTAASLAHRFGRCCRCLGWLALVGLALLGLQAGAPVSADTGAASPRASNAGAPAAVATAIAPVIILKLDGVVGPASADYLVRGLREAARRDASAVVLQIDTPGGLDTSMRAIVRAIVASPVPVIGFVAPGGARAASAGTFLLYGTHLAAMAPATNVGAATPVAIGGAPSRPPGGDRPSDAPAGDPSTSPGKSPAPTGKGPSEAKAINDAVAYLRSLAELRGRNADWAEQAVRDAASLSSRAALDLGVIELIAGDLDELLDKADGRQVSIGEVKLTLTTRNAPRITIDADWRTRALGFITNPNIALMLMMLGVYGLLFEFMTPGAIAPGVVGGIALLLGLYALSMLPLSITGIALMVLGLALLVAEAFVPAFGVLGLGGLAALAIGAAMLVDVENLPAFEVGWPILAGLVVGGAGLILLIARAAVGSRGHRLATGPEAISGQFAEVQDWQDGAGHVFFHGERWNAVADEPIAAGSRVRIIGRDGLTLSVSAAHGPPPPT